MAKIVQSPQEVLNFKIGSPYYVSPEVLKGKYSSKCDIWSIGVVLYVLLCGYPPFYSEVETDIFDMIEKSELEFDGPEWNAISSNAKDLISKMICKEAERITLDEALKHQWFKNNVKIGRNSGMFSVDKILAFKRRDFISKLSIYYLST